MSYVVGDFDHEKISFNNTTKPKTFDSGFGNNPPKDRSWTRGLYATNAFLDDKGRRMMVGWVNGFRSKLGWNGCMSLPRVLTLGKDNTLIQTPAPELKKLRGKHHSATNMVLNNENSPYKCLSTNQCLRSLSMAAEQPSHVLNIQDYKIWLFLCSLKAAKRRSNHLMLGS